MTTSTVGLLAGLLLGVAAAAGGFTGFLIALVLGVIGYLVGGQRDAAFAGGRRPGTPGSGVRRSPPDTVSGATYTYLLNGQAPDANWTGLFRPGERLRLRLINGSAMSYFDLRIPGLKMTVVAADGQYVHPVTIDEFRIATAETFDVIVEPSGQDAFTIFAQDMGRTGFVAGTLAGASMTE